MKSEQVKPIIDIAKPALLSLFEQARLIEDVESFDANTLLSKVEKLSSDQGREQVTKQQELSEKLGWVFSQIELESISPLSLITSVEDIQIESCGEELASSVFFLSVLIALQLLEKGQQRVAFRLCEKILFEYKLDNPEVKETRVRLADIYSEALKRFSESADPRKEKKSFLKWVELSSTKVEKFIAENKNSLTPASKESESLTKELETSSNDNEQPEEAKQQTAKRQTATPVALALGAIFLLIVGLSVALVYVFQEPVKKLIASFPNSPSPEISVTSLSESGTNSENGNSQSTDSQTKTATDSTKKPNNLEDNQSETTTKVQVKGQNQQVQTIKGSFDNLATRLKDLNSKKLKADPGLSSNSPLTLPTGLIKKSKREDLALPPARREEPPARPQEVRKDELTGRAEKVPHYQVQKYDVAREFKILVATEVYTAPSLTGVSVARLEPGAVVLAVAKLGPWLELRSKEGRSGYIYAQDTETLKR